MIKEIVGGTVTEIAGVVLIIFFICLWVWLDRHQEGGKKLTGWHAFLLFCAIASSVGVLGTGIDLFEKEPKIQETKVVGDQLSRKEQGSTADEKANA